MDATDAAGVLLDGSQRTMALSSEASDCVRGNGGPEPRAAIREQQGSRTCWEWFRVTRQSELMVVAGEDIAALFGLVFALVAVPSAP